MLSRVAAFFLSLPSAFETPCLSAGSAVLRHLVSHHHRVFSSTASHLVEVSKWIQSVLVGQALEQEAGLAFRITFHTFQIGFGSGSVHIAVPLVSSFSFGLFPPLPCVVTGEVVHAKSSHKNTGRPPLPPFLLAAERVKPVQQSTGRKEWREGCLVCGEGTGMLSVCPLPSLSRISSPPQSP